MFIANRGQVHHSVRFTAKSPGFTAYFTAEEVVIDVLNATIRMRYLGANVSPDLGGLDLQEGKANYLIGNDPSNWQTDVPLFGRLVYRDLYPGIDMFYSSSTRRLKSEFVVAPGADPSRIQIAYTGVAGIRIDEAGGLILSTPDGELREAAPVIYQETGGRIDPVNGAFRVSGDVVSFFVEQYDRSRELRIDPVLSYSTYLGGNGTNRGNAIAVDSSNSAYITGYTDATNFPVAGAAQNTSGGGYGGIRHQAECGRERHPVQHLSGWQRRRSRILNCGGWVGKRLCDRLYQFAKFSNCGALSAQLRRRQRRVCSQVESSRERARLQYLSGRLRA
jgi:hypothetical protein